MKRLSALAIFLFLALPSIAMAADEEEFNPEHDFDARRVDPDPPRPDRPLDQQGRRLPDSGHDLHDRARPLPDARADRHEERGRAAPGGRRDRLRDRADAGRRAGPAAQGDRAVVPLRRLADALHLGDQHARLHPAAALERDSSSSSGVELPTLADLRGHVVDQRHARARADDLRLHPRRGHPLQRRRSSTSRAGSRTCRRRCTR